jgi:hypothetical protein
MLAFSGIFDGHDGPLAAEYCANGLLQHILMETISTEMERAAGMSDSASQIEETFPSTDRTDTKASSLSIWDHQEQLKDLDKVYVRAFHHAQDQFAATGIPPTFDDVAASSTKRQQQSKQKKEHYHRGRRLRRKLFGSRFRFAGDIRPGGSTACTLSIVSMPLKDEATLFGSILCLILFM